MKVDREVEVSPLQLEAESQILPKAPRSVRFRCDDHAVKMRIALNDGSSEWFNEIAELSGWIRFPDRSDRRRGQNDIANQTESNQEDSGELVSCRGGLVSWRGGDLAT